MNVITSIAGKLGIVKLRLGRIPRVVSQKMGSAHDFMDHFVAVNN
jgi:hypothetical protein